MSVEPGNEPEALIEYLSDRIEEIERALHDDEDFCNRDIDATYQAATKYIQSLEQKFREKLQELKKKLEQVREENVKTSKQNRKEFNEETEVINQLFCSGKHQEAKQRLEDYEKNFEERATIIQTIPILHMKELDVSQYVSFGKPAEATQQEPSEYPEQVVKADTIQPDSQGLHRQEPFKSVADIRYRCSDSQQVPTNSHPTNRETKSPVATVSTGPSRFSTRLASSSSNKSLSLSDGERTTPPTAETNSINASASMGSYTPVRSAPSASSVTTLSNRYAIFTAKPPRGEGLTPVIVAHYQYERNTSLLMACNKEYIVLFKSRSDRLDRWSLNAIVRYSRAASDLDWDDPWITSVGSINSENIYIFTEDKLVIYSLNSFLKVGTWTLSSSSNSTVEGDEIKYGIGTVYHRYIYHISRNSESHWILTLFDLESMNNLFYCDLSDAFPDVQRFIHICVNDQTVGFLVQLHSSQYAAIFCSNNTQLSMLSRGLINLTYAGHPLTICSVYISSLGRHVYFVNDPSQKIIHLLTIEKYLQSYPIRAHSLCYVKDTDEVMFASDDGIYSIRLKEQESFFSKFH